MAEETDFSKKMQELEAITAWFESDNVDLTQALAKFERGMTLVSQLREQLDGVENKVEKIKQKFDATAAPVAETEDETEAPPELF